MITALLTGVAGTAIGAGLGLWTRHILSALSYRRDEEHGLPAPGPHRWIVWASALSLGSISVWIAANDSWGLAPVLLPLALAGPALAAIDLDVMRLPNAILGPATLTIIAGLASTILTRGEAATALRGLGIGTLAGGIFWLLNVVSRDGVGFGDVKLAALIGASTGAVGVAAAWWSLLIGSAVALVWMNRRHLAGPLPFGPWLLVGGWLGPLVAI
jgi:leader peptidase (prepilin peptidase)/N-methyltransferase